MDCHGFVGEIMLRGRAGGVKGSTRLIDAGVVGSVPHRELPAKSVGRGGPGKWVVDAGRGGDRRQVRPGVCEGAEEGQRVDP